MARRSVPPSLAALREVVARIEAGAERAELPADLIRAAGFAPSAIWNALISINAAAMLEGTDIPAEARARLLAFLRRLLAQGGADA